MADHHTATGGAPLLTRAELYRPTWYIDRGMAARHLAEDTLAEVRVCAWIEARAATRDGREWPTWVTAVFGYECDRRDRAETRRELRILAGVES